MTITLDGRTPTEILRALRGRSPAFVVRLAARLAARPLLRRRVATWSAQITPESLPRLLGVADRAAVLAHLRGPAFDGWLHAPARNDVLRRALLDAIPGVADDARRRAAAALQHQVDLLGSGPVSLGDRIDWLADFRSGHRWEPAFCRAIDYTNWERRSDVKVVWELSRAHQLVDLAREALLGGDARCVEEIGAQLRSWLDANPLGGTVNWSCTMDVAIRAVNWIWALSVVAPQVDDDTLLRVGASLWQHGLFVAAALERSDVNGNHLLSDAVGLVGLGAFFRDTAQGRRWLRTGAHILCTETLLQLHPDGVDHEASIPYHGLVCELLLTGFLLMRRAGLDVPAECWDRLHRGAEFCAAYTRPDGSIPVIGDADDGRLQRFGARHRGDHRHLLSTCAVAFEDGALRTAAGSLHEDTMWLLGADAADRFAALPAAPSAPPRLLAFADGGFAVLRGDGAHVVMDAGPVGLRGRGGHGHNDALHVDVWLDGPLVVDRGAYVYTADAAARNRFRASAAHNGPVLRGEEIAEMGDERNIWVIADQAHARIVSSSVAADGSAIAVGRHDGYSRFGSPCAVVRETRVAGGDVSLRDTVERGEWTTMFTLHPSVAVSLADDGLTAVLERDGRAPVWLRVSASGAVMDVVDGEFSPSYGVRLGCRALRVRWEGGVMTTRIESATAAGLTAGAASVAAGETRS